MFAFLSFIVIPLLVKNAIAQNSVPSFKCCDNEYLLSDSFACIKDFANITSNGTLLEDVLNVSNETESVYNVCVRNQTEQSGTNDTCVDLLANGTQVILTCNESFLAINETRPQCDNIFTTLKFWGASMKIISTIIYNIPFILVVLIYCALPTLRARAYDKAVLSYNTCYMVINFFLIMLGFYSLCHERLSKTTYRLFGLSLMFFTQGSVVWLFIICFDMTLVITRFRWAPKGGADRGREEKRKFLIYAAWGWGVPSLLTLIAAIAEFSPMFSKDSPLRPHFHKFRGPNVGVIVYVTTGPVVVCLINTFLFIYTTAKTIAVQRSTAIINENRKNNVKKKYLLFLKLYLLMDTPWLTSALAAIYPDLWLLKFIKMIQPIILLILILPRKRIIEAMSCRKGEHDEEEAVRLNDETQKKNNLPTTVKLNRAEKC